VMFPIHEGLSRIVDPSQRPIHCLFP
jgi:hypothetical protein